MDFMLTMILLHSIIDPVKMKAYAESSGPVKHEGNLAVAAADAFRESGSLPAARCVIHHMETEARGRSLAGKMSSRHGLLCSGMGPWCAGYRVPEGSQCGRRVEGTEALILPWLHEVA